MVSIGGTVVLVKKKKKKKREVFQTLMYVDATFCMLRAALNYNILIIIKYQLIQMELVVSVQFM